MFLLEKNVLFLFHFSKNSIFRIYLEIYFHFILNELCIKPLWANYHVINILLLYAQVQNKLNMPEYKALLLTIFSALQCKIKNEIKCRGCQQFLERIISQPGIYICLTPKYLAFHCTIVNSPSITAIILQTSS